VVEKTPSWSYWSGVLHDRLGERFGLMHAVFEAPDGSSFSHTSVVDLRSGVVRAGDHHALQIQLPPLPVPPDPRQHDVPAPEYHASDVVAVRDSWLKIDGERYKGLDGALWYEFERRDVTAASAWRWISLRLNDGRFVMLYDRSDRPARYAVRTGGEWELIEATVSNCADRSGDSWRVEIGDETFAVIPVMRGQEVRDDARGLCYTEALCTVYCGAAVVGSAYVEVFPSAPVAQEATSYTRPPEAEMFLRWAKGDEEAALLMSYFGYATQVADDLVDGDTAAVASLRRRSDAMMRLLYTLLVQIPGNRFFRVNERHFPPLFVSCLTMWDASNAWADAEKIETRMFSYVTREACGRLLEMVAYLVGGLDWMRQVTRELHDYYHGEHGVESFAAWDAERASRPTEV
jgi:hypothetical protein